MLWLLAYAKNTTVYLVNDFFLMAEMQLHVH